MKKNGEFVGVDEKYVPEDEKYVDESFLGKNKKIPKFVKILIGGVIGIYITILITVFITIIIGVFLTMGLSFKITNIASEGFDFIFDQINGFLYNMVRIISGTLLEVGIGKIKPEEIINIIEEKNREKAGRTLPAHGLYLVSVKY